MERFGLLKYNSINIGDEVQCVAAMRFLPHIDEHIPREQISNFKSQEGKVKLLMNAWWMWQSENFPPSKDIIPLNISMFVRSVIRETFLTEETRKYFSC